MESFEKENRIEETIQAEKVKKEIVVSKKLVNELLICFVIALVIYILIFIIGISMYYSGGIEPYVTEFTYTVFYEGMLTDKYFFDDGYNPFYRPFIGEGDPKICYQYHTNNSGDWDTSEAFYGKLYMFFEVLFFSGYQTLLLLWFALLFFKKIILKALLFIVNNYTVNIK